MPVLLGDFFLPRHSGRPEASEGPLGFQTVGDTEEGAALPERCRAAFAALPSGGILAVTVDVDVPGRIRRVAGLLGLRARMARAENAVASSGGHVLGRYGVYPDSLCPTIVYRLDSAAAGYSVRHLMAGPRSLPSALVRWALALWAGCNPSLGTVLIVGRKT